jgi:hypothetical protein
MEEFKCMKCEQGGRFISPDFKTILCGIHKEREESGHDYYKTTGFGTHFNTLYTKLEMIFIDFQTCLAIVEMFSYEEKALKINLSTLKKFQEDLDKEMKSLNDWFTEGIFTLNSFYTFQF